MSVLGRLSTAVASLLRGKRKPTFTPGVDTGDFVIVVNAGRVKLTGNKWDDKRYYRHTGYPGGLKQETAAGAARQGPGAHRAPRSGGCSRRTGSAGSCSRS